MKKHYKYTAYIHLASQGDIDHEIRESVPTSQIGELSEAEIRLANRINEQVGVRCGFGRDHLNEGFWSKPCFAYLGLR